MPKRRRSAEFIALAGGLAVTGCCHAPGPDPAQSVAFQVATAPAMGGALTIRSFRMVVGRTALGGPTGCADCQAAGTIAPRLVSVPLDGVPVPLGAEQVSAGQYTGVELTLTAPDTAMENATPDWPEGTTLALDGAFNGTAFALRLSIQGTVHEELRAPLDLPSADSETPLDVVVTLTPDAWFRNGEAWLDPGDPAQRALVETNVQRTFQGQVSQ